LSIRRFFIYSILVHITILIVFNFAPVPKEKPKKIFTANLVTPEELRTPVIKPPELKTEPLPLPPLVREEPDLPPVDTGQPPEIPVQDAPMVPGEGIRGKEEEIGKPLPEEEFPKYGLHDKDQAGEETGTAQKSQSKPSEKPGFLKKRQLYDKGVIDAIAKREVAGKTTQDKSITFNTSEYKYLGYLTLLRQRIEGSGCWAYPHEAATRGIYGDLVIRFTINKNGTLGSVNLIRTSGHQSLDNAAMEALRDCGPYWPLPAEWGMDEYAITGHFIYLPGLTFIR
jgi:protein TonB